MEEKSRVKSAEKKLIDVIAYETTLIRRPRIIYISIDVVISDATRNLYIS